MEKSVFQFFFLILFLFLGIILGPYITGTKDLYSEVLRMSSREASIDDSIYSIRGDLNSLIDICSDAYTTCSKINNNKF